MIVLERVGGDKGNVRRKRQARCFLTGTTTCWLGSLRASSTARRGQDCVADDGQWQLLTE